MSNSPLVSYTRLSPNHSGKRTHAIDTISIHCMAGNLSVETCGAVFAPTSRQASSNYGIGSDGRIALYVDEANRSWCTSSAANDHRAVTIEVANSGGAPDWPVSAKAYAALLDLVTDICKRNGIKRLLWEGDKSLIGQVGRQNLTVHRWFAAKACPGDYLYELHGAIAKEVNSRLSATAEPAAPTTQLGSLKIGDVVEFTGSRHYANAGASTGPSCKPGKAKITAIADGKPHPFHLRAVTGGGSTVYGWVDAANIKTGDATTFVPYLVKVAISDLHIRTGPGTGYNDKGYIKPGVYTITEEAAGPGASKWGRVDLARLRQEGLNRPPAWPDGTQEREKLTRRGNTRRQNRGRQLAKKRQTRRKARPGDPGRAFSCLIGPAVPSAARPWLCRPLCPCSGCAGRRRLCLPATS